MRLDFGGLAALGWAGARAGGGLHRASVRNGVAVGSLSRGHARAFIRRPHQAPASKRRMLRDGRRVAKADLVQLLRLMPCAKAAADLFQRQASGLSLSACCEASSYPLNLVDGIVIQCLGLTSSPHMARAFSVAVPRSFSQMRGSCTVEIREAMKAGRAATPVRSQCSRSDRASIRPFPIS